MVWPTAVSITNNEHLLRQVLMGSLATWNLLKISLAFKNVFAALRNEIDILEPYTDAAYTESAQVIIESVTDLLLKLAKLSYNFHPYIWDQTSKRFGLNGLTSRALCYLFLINFLQQVEEGITFILLRLISTHREPLKTAIAHGALTYTKRTALSCLEVIKYNIFSREFACSLNVSWKLFNSCCVQPLKTLRSQQTGAEVPETFQVKATQVGFPEQRIRIGSAPEPRAKFFKVCFLNYIIVNRELLSLLSDDQALAIFCRELGHWELGHVYIRAVFIILESVLGELLLLACGTKEVSSFFHIDPGAPIVVYVSLIKYFVRSMLSSFIRGFAGFVNAQLEIGADEFASQGARPPQSPILVQLPRWNSLVEAWKKLAEVDPGKFQFFDESFAEFFHGEPTIPYRMKAGRKLRFSPNVREHQISIQH